MEVSKSGGTQVLSPYKVLLRGGDSLTLSPYPYSSINFKFVSRVMSDMLGETTENPEELNTPRSL